MCAKCRKKNLKNTSKKKIYVYNNSTGIEKLGGWIRLQEMQFLFWKGKWGLAYATVAKSMDFSRLQNFSNRLVAMPANNRTPVKKSGVQPLIIVLFIPF